MQMEKALDSNDTVKALKHKYHTDFYLRLVEYIERRIKWVKKIIDYILFNRHMYKIPFHL
jgi:hypothetical protein